MNGTATLDAPISTESLLTSEEPLYEVVYGQRVELLPMSIYSIRIASRLQERMGPFAEEHRHGTVVTEAVFILDAERDLRRRPDVAFVSADRWPLDRELPEEGEWEVIPDLAVEVLSPNDLFLAVLAKLQEYFEVGVRQAWVVIPSARQVWVFDSPTQVRILTDADELDGGPLLSGFRLQVGSLFQRRAGGN